MPKIGGNRSMARRSLNAHLRPRPVDFRAEEHGRLSVTLEHVTQNQVSTSSFGCGIQPDGQRPSDKTIGEGDDVFKNTRLRNRCRRACSTRGLREKLFQVPLVEYI